MEFCENRYPLALSLAVITKMYYGVLTKQLSKIDLDKHFSILLFITYSNKPCNQQYLSNTFKIDKTLMVRIIDYMVKKGYVKRSQNKNDRRECILELTQKAKKNIKYIEDAITHINTITFKGFEKSEIARFYASLNSIYNNLHSLPSNSVTLHLKSKKQNR